MYKVQEQNHKIGFTNDSIHKSKISFIILPFCELRFIIKIQKKNKNKHNIFMRIVTFTVTFIVTLIVTFIVTLIVTLIVTFIVILIVTFISFF